MAHRKLQQEIDRVFKKINEGLEIFDMYYERHESCINNPSQKDKLESDLKREVKKLQRLREQIKSWQSSPDVKDKESLLNYRRSVEVAMEKYKAVEKASKEKAYSNISLKKSDVLDPQEKERREVDEFLSQQIEELERQFDLLQIELDKLIALQKKKKTASSENEKKIEQYKEMQTRYRYHQQQMELALRLIANEELDPQLVKNIEEELTFYVEENQSEGFVEDDSIYEGLNLQSNEAIAHEVAASFAARAAGEVNGVDGEIKDTSKLSKKELRKLEREAKKNARAAAKVPLSEGTSTPIIPGQKLSEQVSLDEEEMKESTSLPETKTPPTSASPSPSPPTSSELTHSHLPSTASTTVPSKPQTPLTKPTSISSGDVQRSFTPEVQGFTHIHQTLNGLTTATLKPAPIKISTENKWALATEKKLASLKAKNLINAPAALKPVQTAPVSSVSTSQSFLASNQEFQSAEKSVPLLSSKSNVEVDKVETNHINGIPSPKQEPIFDDYEVESTDDELSEEPKPEILSEADVEAKKELRDNLQVSLSDDLTLLTLPNGIQDIIMGSVISKNKLYPNDGKNAGYRRLYDTCQPSRLSTIPMGVHPPQPLDVTRCVYQWDQIRLALNVTELTAETVIDKFRHLETFTLFYNYYFSITPLEQKICATLLRERDWKVLKSGDCWFLRQGNVKFSNEQYEIADYKIFKLDIWTVVDKMNFKLDFTLLADDMETNETKQKNGSKSNESAAFFGQ